MTLNVTLPPPIRPGDRVAVVSPSWCAPAAFPLIHEQALGRIRDLGLVAVEFPFTRVQGSPAERAEDLMRAFEDDSIGAVMATIGGDYQITVLPHLEPTRMLGHPKRFLGYSDNTNLSNWLWFHGIGGVYGGSTAVHLGPGPQIDPDHLPSLRAAFFGGDLELSPPTRTRDYGVAWDSASVLTETPSDWAATPWQWSGPGRSVTGTVWGRPPVSTREDPRTEVEAADLRAQRREVVLRAVADYNPELVVVLDVDFGHTSPQLLLPYGGKVTVDGEQQLITAHFG